MKLQQLNKMAARLAKRKAPPKYNKDNYIGVEIECLSPIDRETFSLLIAPLSISKYINIGYDESIDTDTDYDGDRYGLEFRVCAKDKDIYQVVKDLLEVMGTVDCEVNSSCGLHVHLDARNKDPKVMFARLLHNQDTLYSVTYNRAFNDFCVPLNPYKYNGSISDACAMSDHYTAINASAYNKYKTIEVRMMNGTLNVYVINNWIKMLLCIVNNKPMTKTLIEFIKDRTFSYGKWSAKKHFANTNKTA